MHKRQGRSIFQCGREITKEELDEIQETVRLFPALSRTELAATICEHLEWFTASGGYKTDACRELLEKLEAKGCIKLPHKREVSQQRQPPIVLTSRTEPKADAGSLSDIAPVSLRVVKDKELTGLWNEYVSRYHYLGYRRPFGCFLRYLVESERAPLGCLMFQGASKALRARDEWIGWRQRQRLMRDLSVKARPTPQPRRRSLLGLWSRISVPSCVQNT